MADTGRGGDVKPWRPLCSGAASDPVPKLAVILVRTVKSRLVDPLFYAYWFPLCLRENDGTRFVIC